VESKLELDVFQVSTFNDGNILCSMKVIPDNKMIEFRFFQNGVINIFLSDYRSRKKTNYYLELFVSNIEHIIDNFLKQLEINNVILENESLKEEVAIKFKSLKLYLVFSKMSRKWFQQYFGGLYCRM
jgi:hypothetical protein